MLVKTEGVYESVYKSVSAALRSRLVRGVGPSLGGVFQPGGAGGGGTMSSRKRPTCESKMPRVGSY